MSPVPTRPPQQGARFILAVSVTILMTTSMAGCGSSTPSVPSPETAEAAPSTWTASEPWRDPDLSANARAEALLAVMTLDEKLGQMTQLESGSVDPNGVAEYLLGALLSGGDGGPADKGAESWYRFVDAYQRAALATRLGIPILFGIDAVHGNNKVVGATIFPHNVGLGAIGDPGVVERIARATALEMSAVGIRWDFAPVLAVPQDVRWG
ncbi:MAG TPA: glycoside hydrolase family 3 N-terminal domain-containing protein, partial [Candidatus Limnocylindrales bacterium]|nr:glycoside hydrolase family 3 N-terminal domain-containing protein [Candidatus Limnocylindrales bacterium]